MTFLLQKQTFYTQFTIAYHRHEKNYKKFQWRFGVIHRLTALMLLIASAPPTLLKQPAQKFHLLSLNKVYILLPFFYFAVPLHQFRCIIPYFRNGKKKKQSPQSSQSAGCYIMYQYGNGADADWYGCPYRLHQSQS